MPDPILGIEPFDRRATALRRRPVIQLTQDGRFVNEWVSTRAVADNLKINRNTLYLALSGRKELVLGFKWVYKDQWNGAK